MAMDNAKKKIALGKKKRKDKVFFKKKKRQKGNHAIVQL